MDKRHGTSYNKGRKKLSKTKRKRVFLVTVAEKTKKPVNPFFMLVHAETPVQTVKGTQIKKMRSIKKSLCQRYLEEKYER